MKARPRQSALWEDLEGRLQLQKEVPVQLPGASLRGYLCAGLPLERNGRWYDASGVLALNHLAGSRILPNLWEHFRAGNASKKEAQLTTIADFLDATGKMRAPLLDKRAKAGTSQGDDTWTHLNMSYVRACGREFRTRMQHARSLDKENEMRALMDPWTLNEMLSAYCGAEGSRNCLLICHQVSTAAPGKGPDRSRLYHRKQVAVPFRYQRGQWWFGDAAKPRWYPTLGEQGTLPPLEYMDVGSLYVPVEVGWRPAADNFA